MVGRKLQPIKLIHNNDDLGTWVEDSRRVFTEVFKTGIPQTRYQMIRLYQIPQNQVCVIQICDIEPKLMCL